MPFGIKFCSLRDRFSCQTSFAVAALFLFLTGESKAVGPVSIEIEIPSLETAAQYYNSGRYEETVQLATQGQEMDPWVDDWELFKSRALIDLGRYDDAYQSLKDFVDKHSNGLRTRLLLREAALLSGLSREAERQTEALAYLVNSRSRSYSYDPENVVAIGRIALLFNIEPKIVLENFYRRAQEYSSKPMSSFLETGNLALSKSDYKLASQAFQEGLLLYPDNVDLLHGLAASYREGDRSKLLEYAERIFAINPRHVPTHVLVAEHLITAEAYDEANAQLDQALLTNPNFPNALAVKAALAYIRNDSAEGDTLRAQALSKWTNNPEIDYRIGQQLSRKYRFSDGANHQRIALGLDETYNSARIQLAQDLLRLGRNDEAWALADAVHESDPYNISAYNLATLRDRLDTFATIKSEHFLLRMSTDEAPIYGQRATRILEDAHARLTARYQIELPQKTTVEIYPNPADFETRTFGMPGNPGYLGVCFGPVFTINSPATRSANWEAVLYHEFCHTITLSLTNNRMPRWLSEGISVYEEQLANPAWGQRMTAPYRNRIHSGQMLPISSMSSAFLQAKDGEDIQFAYYQSYLVVEYIAQNFGMEPLRNLLVSLGKGETMNDSLATHLAPLEELDAGFAAFAEQEAKQLASSYRFESPDGPLATALQVIAPKKNYHDDLRRALDLLAAEDWNGAISILEKLVEDAGYLPGKENAHWPLSTAYREIGDTEKETAILAEIIQHEANRISPVTRLLEIAKETQAFSEIQKWAEAWVAINPMAETPWRSLLRSARELGNTIEASEAAGALIALGVPDQPALNFQMAELIQSSDPAQAKRHVLLALEEAPRFEQAYRLLRELQLTINAAESDDLLEGLDLNNDFLD